jgi:hypothetical protein
MNAALIKDEIRYLTRSDKIEIYKWLDGEIEDELPSRIRLRRTLSIRQDLEQRHKADLRTERASDRPGAVI